jgi:hypothetical protein
MSKPIERTYREGATLPSLEIEWYAGPAANASLVDFSVSHQWLVEISRTDGGPAIVDTTSVTGAATAPNVTIAWDVTDLGALTAGVYWMQIKATRVSDSKVRFCPQKIRLVIEEAT